MYIIIMTNFLIRIVHIIVHVANSTAVHNIAIIPPVTDDV